MFQKTNIGSTVFTSLSAMLGGTTVAIEKMQIASITLSESCDVAFYAVISAFVGIGVKFSVDKIRSCFRKWKRNR